MRRWLGLHGIRIKRVINGDEHAETMRAARLRSVPSKYPPHFGIQLHIDDSAGVGEEGRAHGFEVLVIAPTDKG